MITVERTGNIYSFEGVEYRATYPDGTQETFWSPPWAQKDDGTLYEDDEKDTLALKEAERRWNMRQLGIACSVRKQS